MGLGPFDSEIFPMMIVLTQFDPASVSSAGGYDDIAREPILTDGDGDNIGEYPSQLQTAEVKVPGQVESSSLEALSMSAGGDLPDSSIQVSFSRGRLESLSLMNADGRPKIKKGDRWIRLEDMSGNIMWTFDRPAGGLYCDEIRMSDAFIGGRSNWFLATFKSRRGKQGPLL